MNMINIDKTYNLIKELSTDPYQKDFMRLYLTAVDSYFKSNIDSLYESLITHLDDKSKKLATGLFTAYQVQTGGLYSDYSWEKIYDLALESCKGNSDGYPYSIFTLLSLDYGSEFNCSEIISTVSSHLFDFIRFRIEVTFRDVEINFYLIFNKLLLLAYKRNIRNDELLRVCKYIVEYTVGFDTLTKSNATAYLGQWQVIPDGVIYVFDQSDDLITKFDNLESVQHNYSQAMQDMFILTMTNGMYEGTFLEIGSAYPIYENNTYLLEKQFDWRGISIDYSEQYKDEWIANRKVPYLCANALEVDYKSLTEQFHSKWIDYLQVDLDPASMTLEVLKKVMSESTVKFGLITFEHDAYRFGNEVRDEQRKLLESLGYELIVPDVCVMDDCAFEDWWRHKDYPIKINPQFRQTNGRYVFNQMFYKS